MARRFTCGFEENNVTATMWHALSGMTIVTTSPHSGTYNLQVNSNTDTCRRDFPANKTTGTLWFRFSFRADGTVTTGGTLMSDPDLTDTADNIQVQITTAGVIRIRNAVTGTTADGTTDVTDGAWHRIEVAHVIANAGGSVTLRIDGTQEAAITGEDTLANGPGRMYLAFVSIVGLTNARFDDVAINDESGTFQNSWPGEGNIALQKPAAEGATINFTPLSGTDNALMVDDVPGTPDDDTTYNSTSTTGAIDRLTLTGLPAGVPSNAVIVLCDVYARIRGEGTTGTRTARVKLWDEGGTVSNGPTSNLIDNSAYRIMTTAEHLVYNASGKTKANIDSFNAGYEEIESNDPMRVTALWVNVEWTPAPAGGIAKLVGSHQRLAGFGGGLAA